MHSTLSWIEHFDPPKEVLVKRIACLLIVLLFPEIAGADVTLLSMEGRLAVETNGDGSSTVSLLAGGPLGLGGVAAGRTTVDGTTDDALWLAGTNEVAGIEPTPFFPAGEGDVSGVEPTPFAPRGERVLSFHFDSAGDYSGIEPTPFHVFLFTPSGLVGELLFDGVTAQKGSLILTGVAVDPGGGVTEIPTFTIEALPQPVPLMPGAGAVGLTFLFLTAGLLALRRRSRRMVDRAR
jgi:hypothetical protein